MDAVQPRQAQTEKPTRPPGEVGGHTVQPGEQPSMDTAAGTTIGTSRATPSPSLPEEGPRTGSPRKRVSAPSVPAEMTREAPNAARSEPPSTGGTVGHEAGPRSDRVPVPTVQGPVAADARPARTGASVAQHEELVVQITANLAEMLARALRQSVEEAVTKALADSAARQPALGATRAAEAQKPQPAAGASGMQG